MALTIKRRSQSQSSYSFVADLIETTIKDKIFNTLGIKRKSQIRMIDYFLTFSLCEVSNEKVVASIFARTGSGCNFKSIDVREIEISGVTIVEFLDYLDEHGAHPIENSKQYLNYM